MSGYYPAGVTGNEPQIAGYTEGEFEMTCTADEPYVVHTEKAGDDVYDLVKEILNTDQAVTSADIWAAIAKMKARWDREGYVAECHWEGRVEGTLSGGVLLWTCPNCGTEQETDLDDGGPEADRW